MKSIKPCLATVEKSPGGAPLAHSVLPVSPDAIVQKPVLGFQMIFAGSDCPSFKKGESMVEAPALEPRASEGVSSRKENG